MNYLAPSLQPAPHQSFEQEVGHHHHHHHLSVVCSHTQLNYVIFSSFQVLFSMLNSLQVQWLDQLFPGKLYIASITGAPSISFPGISVQKA